MERPFHKKIEKTMLNKNIRSHILVLQYDHVFILKDKIYLK